MKLQRILWLIILFLPCAVFGEEAVYNFETEAIMDTEGPVRQCKQFVFTLTGEGDTDNLDWQIKEDAGAPSPKKVLAILKADAVDTGYPMALLKGKRYQDVDVSVKFKILGGNVNQAAGLVFRAVDSDHGYFVRISAIDNSVVLMRVNKKQLNKLGSGKVSVGLNRWNSLRVEAKGIEINVYYNDTKLFTVKDDVYPLGKVGMVTEADSMTYFDDFTVKTGGP